MSTLKHPPTRFSGNQYAIRAPGLSVAQARTSGRFRVPRRKPRAIKQGRRQTQSDLIAAESNSRSSLSLNSGCTRKEATGSATNPFFHRWSRPQSPPYPKNNVTTIMPVVAALGPPGHPTHSRSPAVACGGFRLCPWLRFSRISPVRRVAVFTPCQGDNSGRRACVFTSKNFQEALIRAV